MVCFGEGGQTDRQMDGGRDRETELGDGKERNKRGNRTAAAPERRRHWRQLLR